MGANVNASFEDMSNAATYLETGESDINDKLTDLQNYIENLITGGGFVTDQASVSFGEAFTSFKTATASAIQALSGMGDYLRTAATRLQETDQSLVVNYG
jgi:uncharacterized protein YukE